MGDRANVYIKEDQEHGVYLYTHWGGSELPEMTRTALNRHQRWDDSAYLARIIFCEMIKGREAEETGFGISTRMPDNEHPIIVVDVPAQTVGYAPKPTTDSPLPIPVDPMSFEKFCAQAAEWPERL